MQHIFPLVRRVPDIVPYLLQQDGDEVEHDFSPDYVLGKTTLLSFLNSLPGVLDRGPEGLSSNVVILEPSEHGADFLGLALVAAEPFARQMAVDRVLLQLARGDLVLEFLDVAKRDGWICGCN